VSVVAAGVASSSRKRQSCRRPPRPAGLLPRAILRRSPVSIAWRFTRSPDPRVHEHRVARGLIGFAGVASFEGATGQRRDTLRSSPTRSLDVRCHRVDEIVVRRKRPVLYTAGGTAAAGDPNSQRSFPSGHASWRSPRRRPISSWPGVKGCHIGAATPCSSTSERSACRPCACPPEAFPTDVLGGRRSAPHRLAGGKGASTQP